MEVVALVLAVVLAVGSVVFVARPFVREDAGEETPTGGGSWEEERLRLAEERDRALAALKELEFDHRTGKIADEDYRALVGPLRRQAAEALRALERHPAEASRHRRAAERPADPPGALPSGTRVPEPWPPPVGDVPDPRPPPPSEPLPRPEEPVPRPSRPSGDGSR